MVRHNNQIPNGHFHKKYKDYIKTWFDQPMKKRRRRLVCKRKAVQNLPKPVELLRPIVRCPTVRYNNKIRLGRGFSMQEIKAAGLCKNYAKSIGIGVDIKRRNKSMESQMYNVQRLKEYVNKLIILPVSRKKRTSKIKNPTNLKMEINNIKLAKHKLEARVPTKEEKRFGAFNYLHKCRFEAKLARLKLKREMKKTDNLDLMSTKKVRLQLLDQD